MRAISIGWPRALQRVQAGRSSSSEPFARARSNMGLVMPVSIRPGQIAFTRTPVPRELVRRRLHQADDARPCSRCTGCRPAPERIPATDAVQTIEPPPFSRMTARAVLDREERADQVHAQHVLPVGRRLLEERHQSAADTRVGVDDLEPAELARAGRDELLHRAPRPPRRPGARDSARRPSRSPRASLPRPRPGRPPAPARLRPRTGSRSRARSRSPRRSPARASLESHDALPCQ